MRFGEWFEKNRIKARELAASFPVTVSAVHQWATDGVPIVRMAGVEKFTRRAVCINDMVRESAEIREMRRTEAVKA